MYVEQLDTVLHPSEPIRIPTHALRLYRSVTVKALVGKYANPELSQKMRQKVHMGCRYVSSSVRPRVNSKDETEALTHLETSSSFSKFPNLNAKSKWSSKSLGGQRVSATAGVPESSIIHTLRLAPADPASWLSDSPASARANTTWHKFVTQRPWTGTSVLW